MFSYKLLYLGCYFFSLAACPVHVLCVVVENSIKSCFSQSFVQVLVIDASGVYDCLSRVRATVECF